jgi:cytochrome c oxidase cbb3-type subunit 3
MSARLVLVSLLGLCCSKPPDTAPQGERPLSGSTLQPVGPIAGAGEAKSVANPLGSDRQAVQEGRTLFVRYNCYGCHGGRGGGGMAPSLRDATWLYGNTAGQIFSSIAEGRAHGMPAWGTRLPDKQIWQLVAYIQSLRTKDEPEAPSP